MKKKLTENQREFMITNFFQNEKYAGAKGIAEKLLDKGHCIVAGKDCIWHGGIGNFIKTSEAEDAIDCLLYEFDLDIFKSSGYYKETHKFILKDLAEKVDESVKQFNEIKELV